MPRFSFRLAILVEVRIYLKRFMSEELQDFSTVMYLPKILAYFLSIVLLGWILCACGEEDEAGLLGELTACEQACSRISQEECLSGDGSIDFASTSCRSDCEEGRYGESFASCVLEAMSCEALAACLADIEPGSASQQWNGDADVGEAESYAESNAEAEYCSGSCTEGSPPFCMDDELCACRNGQWEPINCRVGCAELGQTFDRCEALDETTDEQCICDVEPIPEPCEGICEREGQGACRADEMLCICEGGEWTSIDCERYCLEEHGHESGQCTTSAEMNGAQCNCETR